MPTTLASTHRSQNSIISQILQYWGRSSILRRRLATNWIFSWRTIIISMRVVRFRRASLWGKLKEECCLNVGLEGALRFWSLTILLQGGWYLLRVILSISIRCARGWREEYPKLEVARLKNVLINCSCWTLNLERSLVSLDNDSEYQSPISTR